ncbi:hypothetical protein [Cellulomonas massiliensis]|uniref:hypothetical protein n=1 Tax=Cellulomonas massiliensis TaxID=1465811 RepID=UPI0003047209|nr:hypothetical protein [Cellulomonas massiliensis]
MRRTLTTASAVALLPLLVGATASGASATVVAAAGEGDVAVVNTETVQAHLDATGVKRDARVYEQLSFTGTGSATVANPVSTRGLRNLDGFGGGTVEGGALVTTVDVDGSQRLRTVSDYDKELPLRVQIRYTLDGRRIEPGAIVGRSGELEVHYAVTNTTGRDEEVTYDAGGTEGRATARTVIPMVGQLTTTLPSSFTNVRSAEAGTAGDGRGGTKLVFQMTLFPPIGSETIEFGYSATIRKGVVPPASVTAMPVSPLDYPSFKGGSESIRKGGQAGLDLTAGALQLDDGVLALHDGAAELLAGLIQLRDGAAQLEAGLAGQAAPGARELADGLQGRAAPGAQELADGLNDQAAPGARELADGLNDKAAPGARQVADGAAALDGGLTQARAGAPALIDGLRQVDAGLAGVDAGLEKLSDQIGGLPDKAEPLHQGIAKLQQAIGSTSSAGTLLAGLEQLRVSVGTDAPGALAALAAGVYSTDPANPGAYQRLGCAVTVLKDIRDGAGLAGPGGCYASGRPPMPEASATTKLVIDGLISELQSGRARLADPDALGNPNDPAFFGGSLSSSATLQQGLTYVQGRLANIAGPGLLKLQCGLSGTVAGCPAGTVGVLQGVQAVDAGVTELVTGVVSSVQAGVGDDASATKDTLRGGVHLLQGGVDQLSSGGDRLAAGLAQLGAGAGRLSAGASDLSDGIDDAAQGSEELAGGLGDAADGSRTLASGIVDAANGSRSLADGLRDAANGSLRLHQGLEDAADGAPQLVDGTQRLSDEGTTTIAESGAATAASYGVQYAVLQAGAERAQAEGMAYGAPEGALGATAYSLEIDGADATTPNAVGRGLAAIALFAIGAVVATLARRRFV